MSRNPASFCSHYFSTAVLSAALAAALLCGCAGNPETKRRQYLQAGAKMMEKQDYPRAMLEFKNAIKLAPNDAEGYYQLGVATLGMGDFRSARNLFRKATDLNPNHQEAQLKLTEILTSTRDPAALDEAEQRLQSVLSKDPGSARAGNTFALAEFKLGRIDEAEKRLKQILEKSPSYVATYMTLVRLKLARGDVAGAEAALKQATQAAPQSSEAWTTLGLFYVAEKRLPEAEAQLRKALEIAPGNLDALMELGRIQIATGNAQEADRIFAKVSKLPEPGAQQIHAMYLAQAGKLDAAIQEFEQLEKKTPDDRSIRTRLIKAYLLAGRNADAERVLADALKRNPKDVDALLQRAEMRMQSGKASPAALDEDVDAALHSRPDDAVAHYWKAKVYQLRGAERSRRLELTEALKLDPRLLAARLELANSLSLNSGGAAAVQILDQAPEAQRGDIAVLTERNWALIREKRFGDARAGVDRALAISRTPEVLVQDGVLKSEKGDPSARVPIEEALKAKPDDVRALSALVRTYENQKQDSTAIAIAKEYANKQPNSAGLQAYAGELLMNSGDNAGARAYFTKAKALAPGEDRIDVSLAKLDAREGKTAAVRERLQGMIAGGRQVEQAALLLGSTEEIAANYAEAIQLYRKSVDANDRNWMSLNNLAFCSINTGQLDEALKYAQQAKMVAPDNPYVKDTLGWVYYSKGQYGSAVRELEPLATDVRVVRRYHLAMAYFKNGDWDRGRKVLESALKVNPNLPEARTAQQLAVQSLRR